MKYIFVSGIVILGVFLAVLSQIPLGIEPLTELYLENHTELPKNVFLNKDYNFSFSVHNLEYQDMNYEYIVEAYDENGEIMFEIDRGSVLLANKEEATIPVSYSFNEDFKRAKINVKIIKNKVEEPWFERKLWWPDPNYPTQIDVHFWVDEIVPTTITIIPD